MSRRTGVRSRISAAIATWRPRTGGLLAGALVGLAALAGMEGTARAATADCRVADGFSRVESGALYRLQDRDVLGGAATMSDLGQVGSGWTGSAFAWTAAGGDGVLYGLTWSGVLTWYRYDSAGKKWADGSGRVIGTGFVPRKTVANLALGGDGVFYVVRPNGQLVMYRHTGRLTGAATWGNARGWVIGSGWTGTEVIAPDGTGTIYRQIGGRLFWYRHSDPEAGPVTWSTRRLIGTGWTFYDLIAAGGGVLYATQGGTGQVLVYRHSDPVGGANTWASGAGVLKFTARPDSFGVLVDPLACSLQ